MELINDKLINQNCNTNNEAVSLHSLMEDVNKKRCNHEKADISSLYSGISKQYQQFTENHGIEGTKELCTKYFAVPMNLKNDHEKYNSTIKKYHKEETKLRRELMQLEKKLNLYLSKKEVISKEVAALEHELVVTREALSVAKKYYSSVWEMYINIEDSSNESFICTIKFKFDCGKYPIKFVIDRSGIIVDWSCSSLLTKEEETNIKKKYSRTNYYFPNVLSDLRSLALNKTRVI